MPDIFILETVGKDGTGLSLQQFLSYTCGLSSTDYSLNQRKSQKKCQKKESVTDFCYALKLPPSILA